MKEILIYIIAQAICVISSTIKSVVTIKGTKVAAVLTNTIHYVINAAVVYYVAKVEGLWIILLTTAITNLIGVWAGLSITEKFRKDQLWRVSATVKVDYYQDLIAELKAHNFKFVTFETNWDKIKLLDIFSEGRADSSKLHELATKYKFKYTINNSNHKL